MTTQVSSTDAVQAEATEKILDTVSEALGSLRIIKCVLGCKGGDGVNVFQDFGGSELFDRVIGFTDEIEYKLICILELVEGNDPNDLT